MSDLIQLVLLFAITVGFSFAIIEAIRLYRLMKIHKQMRDELFNKEDTK